VTKGKVVLVPFPFDDLSIIERELGSISSDMQNNVDEKLRKLFKLA
jgi:hypothetical protein